MNRRTFLKAIATIGAAAAIPAALIPKWKVDERDVTQYLSFRGHRIIYSKYCQQDTIYFLNPNGLSWNDGSGWRFEGRAVVMNPRRLGAVTGIS